MPHFGPPFGPGPGRPSPLNVAPVSYFATRRSRPGPGRGPLLGPLLGHFWDHFWVTFGVTFGSTFGLIFGSFSGGFFDPESHSRAPFSGQPICQILLGDMGCRSDPGTRARISGGAARRREGGGGRNLSRGDYGAAPLLPHSNHALGIHQCEMERSEVT